MHVLALTDAHAGNPVIGGLIVFVGAIFVAAWWARDRKRFPHVPCRPCGGSGRVWSTLRSAWGPHRACSGTGRRGRSV